MAPITFHEETSASSVMLRSQAEEVLLAAEEAVEIEVVEIEAAIEAATEVVTVTVIVEVEENAMMTAEVVIKEAVVVEETNTAKTVVDMKDATDLTSVNKKKTCSLNRCMITIFGIKSWLPHFIRSSTRF